MLPPSRSRPVLDRIVRLARALVVWTTPRWALLLTVAVGLGVALVLGAVSGEVYESVVESDGVSAFDRPLLNEARALRTPALTHVVALYTTLGGPVVMPVLATAAAVGLALWWRSLTPLVVMAVAGGGSLLMTWAGKAVVGRTRPPLRYAVAPYETSTSFPSGHSLNSVVVAGTVAYLLVLHLHRRLWRVVTVVLAAVFAGAMGLSRVYLGHHWFTDVLVAWTVGLAWLAVVVSGHQVVVRVRTTRGWRGGAPEG